METIIAYNRVAKEVIHSLEKDYHVHYFENGETIDQPLFLDALTEAVGIIGLEFSGQKNALTHAPHLKAIANVSVGYDNLDIAELTKRGIIATNTPDTLTETTADAIFGLMLATARRIPELHNYVMAGKWDNYLKHDQFGVDLHGKTIGIIGMGNIGQALAKRCALGFDMNVIYYNRSRKPHVEEMYAARFTAFDDLLKMSDFVCLTLPATPETKHIISKREFNLMKNSAIYINGSRGINNDEEALFDALNKKAILAAGIDVYQTEPINSDNPLLTLPNIVTLPHIGPATIENELKMSKRAEQNLRDSLNHLKPRDILNPEVMS